MVASLVSLLVKNLPASRRPWFSFWVRKIPWRRGRLPTLVFLGFLVTQTIKSPPAMREAWVQSLGWQDPLAEVMTAHSSVAWRIPTDRGA